MQQSNVIFAYLLVAFILFISLRGELPTYITLLRGGGQQAGNNSAVPAEQNGSSDLGDAAQAVQTIATIASFF